MEASRPPLKRNRNKANVQMNKKYQHLNWPNALTKIENSNDNSKYNTYPEFIDILKYRIKKF